MNKVSGSTKPKVIFLDVYETLLDMGEVEKKVNILLNSKRAYMIWFELFMEYCFVDNCTVQFHDFTSIAKATLQLTAKMLDVSIEEDDCNYILELLKQLPLKEGVQEGLSSLHDYGFRIAALTNVSESTVRIRMEMTGLISYFERVLSAERVKKYKPCREVYDWAAQEMQVRTEEVVMISAHGWDIAGAANTGMQTGLINQGRNLLYSLTPKPDFNGKDLLEISHQLIDHEGHEIAFFSERY